MTFPFFLALQAGLTAFMVVVQLYGVAVVCAIFFAVSLHYWLTKEV